MEKGICCICGHYNNLTYEHIPPQGSGNSSIVKSYELEYFTADNEEKLLENLDKQIFTNLIEGKNINNTNEDLAFMELANIAIILSKLCMIKIT